MTDPARDSPHSFSSASTHEVENQTDEFTDMHLTLDRVNEHVVDRFML